MKAFVPSMGLCWEDTDTEPVVLSMKSKNYYKLKWKVLSKYFS